MALSKELGLVINGVYYLWSSFRSIQRSFYNLVNSLPPIKTFFGSARCYNCFYSEPVVVNRRVSLFRLVTSDNGGLASQTNPALFLINTFKRHSLNEIKPKRIFKPRILFKSRGSLLDCQLECPGSNPALGKKINLNEKNVLLMPVLVSFQKNLCH